MSLILFAVLILVALCTICTALFVAMGLSVARRHDREAQDRRVDQLLTDFAADDFAVEIRVVGGSAGPGPSIEQPTGKNRVGL